MENPGLSSVAIRVHHMDAMLAFYSQAFNVSFREVDTFGIRSQFGEVNGITLKMVPIRDSADFDEYPIHQLGFNVPEIEAVLDLARKHGGRPDGDILRDGNTTQAAVRDPDGNSIELYSSD